MSVSFSNNRSLLQMGWSNEKLTSDFALPNKLLPQIFALKTIITDQACPLYSPVKTILKAQYMSVSFSNNRSHLQMGWSNEKWTSDFALPNKLLPQILALKTIITDQACPLYSPVKTILKSQYMSVSFSNNRSHLQMGWSNEKWTSDFVLPNKLLQQYLL